MAACFLNLLRVMRIASFIAGSCGGGFESSLAVEVAVSTSIGSSLLGDGWLAVTEAAGMGAEEACGLVREAAGERPPAFVGCSCCGFLLGLGGAPAGR